MAFNNSFAEKTQVIELIDKLLAQPKYQNYLNQYMLPHYFKSTIN